MSFDEIAVHLAPVLLGGGVRMYEGLDRVRLERLELESTGQLTDLRYRVPR
jgi:riboflavin biosynthesis pyrimidine reductase